jgi:hypothetical protein
VDKEYLNELISVERGWRKEYITAGVADWFSPDGHPARPTSFTPPDWTSDQYWPELIREGEIAIEWTNGLAVAYFIKADLKPTRGKEIGEVVVRAWARLKGILR